MAISRRSYAMGHYQLVLDNKDCGFVHSTEGGTIRAEVVSEASGPGHYHKKHLGAIHYEPIALQMGLFMGKPVYDWINAAFTGNYARKNGAIVAADFEYNAQSQLDFYNALITEVAIPPMDASSKDPAYFALAVAPESTRMKKASGKVGAGAPKPTAKNWLASNFKLAIDGLDCTRVAKIDGMAIKIAAPSASFGARRDYERLPTRIDFPNLKITFAASSSQTWEDWFENFVVKGNAVDANEKNGELTFLAPDRAQPLGSVQFYGLGIFSLSPEKAKPGESISQMVAELYCERMELEVLN